VSHHDVRDSETSIAHDGLSSVAVLDLFYQTYVLFHSVAECTLPHLWAYVGVMDDTALDGGYIMDSPSVTTIAETTAPSAKKLLTVSGFGLLFDSMDVGLLSFVLASLAKEWHLSTGTSGMIGSVGFIGMAIGSLMAGLFADRFGRKSAFMWTLLIYSIATGLTAFAPGLIVFIILRLLVGFGLGGELPVATTYVLESSPDNVRGRRVVLLESFWALGSLLAALLSRLIIPSTDWRVVFLVGALPALYVFVLRRTLPETPRFARLKERSARRALKTIWSHDLRKSTTITSITWLVMNFVYYGMFFWLPTMMVHKGFTLVTSLSYSLIVILGQVPGYLTAAWLVEKWGRKRVLVTAMILTSFSTLGFGFAGSTAWLITFGILSSYFMLAAFAATYVFTVEQFPTLARASGIGWSAGFGRIGSIIAPYLVGWLMEGTLQFSQIFTLFFITMLVGAMVVWVFGREMKGKPLQ
jgi:MFS transporter, putative metabolite:H+ symporter